MSYTKDKKQINHTRVSKRARNVPKQFLGAFKKGHRFGVRDQIDETISWQLLDKIEASNYTDQESIDNLLYITKFYNEYYKNVIKKGSTTDLHNTQELRQDCYDRTNSRNRDIMSVCANELDSLSVYESEMTNDDSDSDSDYYTTNESEMSSNPEDALIDLIDLKAQLKRESTGNNEQ